MSKKLGYTRQGVATVIADVNQAWLVNNFLIAKFAKIQSRQDARQATFSVF
jgi:hypothetical protein